MQEAGSRLSLGFVHWLPQAVACNQPWSVIGCKNSYRLWPAGVREEMSMQDCLQGDRLVCVASPLLHAVGSQEGPHRLKG
jgi:hypothetical protein